MTTTVITEQPRGGRAIAAQTLHNDGAPSSQASGGRNGVIKQLPPKNLPLGRIEEVSIDKIVIGERFRRKMVAIDRLADSIADEGLISPIILDKDYNLIAGRRRIEAVKRLRRNSIAARIIDIDDPLLAQIDEDVEREELRPSEKFAVTEALRESLQDEARMRRRLAIRIASAKGKKGRADDILAEKVGLSRPTLAKIRLIVQAAAEDPDKFEFVLREMDRDGKIDRAYRMLRQMKAVPVETCPGLHAAVYFADWSSQSTALSRREIQKLLSKMSVRELLQRDGVLAMTVAGRNVGAAISVLPSWGIEFLNIYQSDSKFLILGTCGKPGLIGSEDLFDGATNIMQMLTDCVGSTYVVNPSTWVPDLSSEKAA